MLSTLKMKQVYLPLTLAVAFGLLGWLRLASGNSLHSELGAEAGMSQSSDKPQVTINGQSVDLGADGKGSFDTGDANVSVNGSTTHVTSGGGRTVITNDDGTVNIHVDSVNNGGKSKNKVKYDGDSEYNFHEESSIEVEAGADADISVSN